MADSLIHWPTVKRWNSFNFLFSIATNCQCANVKSSGFCDRLGDFSFIQEKSGGQKNENEDMCRVTQLFSSWPFSFFKKRQKTTNCFLKVLSSGQLRRYQPVTQKFFKKKDKVKRECMREKMNLCDFTGSFPFAHSTHLEQVFFPID